MKLIDDDGRVQWTDEALAYLRRSRELVICMDPDQIRFMNRLLNIIEGLHRRIEKLERSS